MASKKSLNQTEPKSGQSSRQGVDAPRSTTNRRPRQKARRGRLAQAELDLIEPSGRIEILTHGEQIARWRRERKISQRALAAKLPVPLKTLQRWEQAANASVPSYLWRALRDVEREFGMTNLLALQLVAPGIEES